jgi:hypothetical protein
MFNKIRDKGKTVSAWNRGGWGRERGWGEREGVGGRGSNDPIIVCTYE